MVIEKSREIRLRRMAQRQGLRLSRSRARDPRALTYSRYTLVDDRTGFLVNADDPLGRGYPFKNLDQVENWLSDEERP